MHYVRDRTGRFPQRPHYQLAEIDRDCENAITSFMTEAYGGFTLPIPTEALTKLIERDAADLDLFADLSSEGVGVEGVTDFFPGQRPRVRIAASLSEQCSENRLRTTLTHEWGHVRFHDFLWQIEAKNPAMHAQLAAQPNPRCKRDSIVGAPEVDWMEWQAGYVCGSVLMPASHIKAAVGSFCEGQHLLPPLLFSSAQAHALIAVIAQKFAVSTTAARVRLAKLHFLTNKDLGPSLF